MHNNNTKDKFWLNQMEKKELASASKSYGGYLHSYKEYTRSWLDCTWLIDNLLQIDKDPALKRSIDAGDLECTQLFALFHWMSPERRYEYTLSLIDKYLMRGPIFTDETLSKKYNPFIEHFNAPPTSEFNINLLYIIFEVLPQCRRIKTKDFGESVSDKLRDYILSYPECLFKYHLLECYYQPTNASYCYTSLYHLLRKQAPKKAMPVKLVEHLYKVLEMEKKFFYSGNHPPEQIMILLHYLIQLFIYFPVTNQELLKKFHTLCVEFRLLPKPYGILADEFVQLLENEYRSPCTALLYKLREDFPAIDIYTSNAKETKYAEPFEAFLVFDFSVPSYWYLLWKNLPSVKLPSYSQELANELRKCYVLSVFGNFCKDNSFHIKDAYGLFKGETHKKLLTLGQNGYFNIYSKILEIMDRCDELSTASCPEFMRAGIEALSKNVPAESRKNTEEDKFFRVHLTTQYYPDYPLRCIDLRSPVESFLIETLRKYNISRTQSYSTILRLVCIGNDMQFNKFVNNYMKAREHFKANEHSKGYHNILKTEIRIYLIPLGFNTLSQYMATYDDVYNQEVFIPFIKDPLVPKLHSDAGKKGISMEEAEKLGNFWGSTEIQAARERQVQLYLREAIRFMPIKVCKAELVRNDKPDANLIVYFVCRAEVGLHSIYSKAPGSCSQTNLPEMGGKYRGFDGGVPVKLKAQAVNVFNSKKQECENTLEIWSLSIVNVPSEEDVGVEAIPFGASLELTYLENIYQKHYKDYLRKKKGGVTPESYKKIACHMSSLVVNLHVDCVEVASTNACPLPIRIDGVDYNEYHSMKVQIMENITIPLMTFLPIY